MTKEETIIKLRDLHHFMRQRGDFSPEAVEAVKIAIKSLEAWDKLIEKMEEEIYYYDSFPDIWYGISESFDIIKKYLKEVEE